MTLGLNTETGGGDYTPIVKFDARAGRFFRVDREEVGGQWQTDNVEITDGFQALMDLENIEVGWGLFAAGVAPSWALVPLGAAMPARPSDQHKQTFRLMLKLGKASGGDVREFASQSKAVIAAMDDLHTAYEAQKAANPGKLPLVAVKGTKQVTTTGKGQTATNYAPIFEISRWLDRPEGLGGQAPAGSPAPPAPPPPPPAAKQPEQVTASDEEF